MKRITIDKIISWVPCYSREQLQVWFGTRKTTTPQRVAARKDIRASDRLWLLVRCMPSKKQLLFAYDCASRALHCERKAGREPAKASWTAVRIGRAYARGKATEEQRRAASDAAAYAANVANTANVAADASSAATYAAVAAHAAAYAANAANAANAVNAADAAASAAAANVAANAAAANAAAHAATYAAVATYAAAANVAANAAAAATYASASDAHAAEQEWQINRALKYIEGKVK